MVRANGNLDFATTGDSGYNDPGNFKTPKANPQYPRSTLLNPNPTRFPCKHFDCYNNNRQKTISHGEYCDNKTNRWRASIGLNLLFPGLRMNELSATCRSVVLASGSLAPIGSLCSELNLLPPNKEKKIIKKESQQISPLLINLDDEKHGDGSKTVEGRLQITPRPLQANHIINLPKQLLAISIGHFIDGSPLSVKMANYNRSGFYDKLGDCIAGIVEGIPKGGVLSRLENVCNSITIFSFKYSLSRINLSPSLSLL